MQTGLLIASLLHYLQPEVTRRLRLLSRWWDGLGPVCHLVIRGTLAPPRGGLAPYSLPRCGQRSPRDGLRLPLVIAGQRKAISACVCLADTLVSGARGEASGWEDTAGRLGVHGRHRVMQQIGCPTVCRLQPACPAMGLLPRFLQWRAHGSGGPGWHLDAHHPQGPPTCMPAPWM